MQTPEKKEHQAGLMEQLVFNNRPLFALITKTGSVEFNDFAPGIVWNCCRSEHTLIIYGLIGVPCAITSTKLLDTYKL